MASESGWQKINGVWTAIAGLTFEDPTGGCQLPDVAANVDPTIPPTAECVNRNCDGECNLTKRESYGANGELIQIIFVCTCGGAG
jgi:hypothetical protein